ncbi:MAG TPA: potassium channel family protein [Terriglobales bacterium]
MGPSRQLDLPGCLFPIEGQFAGLQVSMSLANSMRNFAVAVRGFPAQIPGQFWRMAYFSATTITTLGFGDIVPLTTAARIVVSLESVLGIVLMGLFLNAVSSPTPQEPRVSRQN